MACITAAVTPASPGTGRVPMTAWTAMPPGAWDARPGQKARAGYLAGATRVVNPQRIGGQRIAAAALQSNVVEFLDVVTHDGSLEFRPERRSRNRFTLNLGLARDGPATCLDALTGEELRVGLGAIGGGTFVNNASFGAYAEVVKSPAYPGRQAGHRATVRTTRLPGRALVGLARPKVPLRVPDRL